jgi:hypothetical protein
MTDKARRMVGIVIAPPLLIVVGMLLCLEGVGHGKMSEVCRPSALVGQNELIA